MSLSTPITELFNIKHPVILAGNPCSFKALPRVLFTHFLPLAGMNVAAGPELAAAVTNAGGLGVIGGVGYTRMFFFVSVLVWRGCGQGCEDASCCFLVPIPFFLSFFSPVCKGDTMGIAHSTWLL